MLGHAALNFVIRIRACVSPNFITVIGRSTGTSYGYLEFLSWDLGRAMECACQYFVLTRPEFAGMLMLNGRNNAVSIYSSDEARED